MVVNDSGEPVFSWLVNVAVVSYSTQRDLTRAKDPVRVPVPSTEGSSCAQKSNTLHTIVFLGFLWK